MDIASINATILDRRTKGFPGTSGPIALADIAKQGWNVLNEDLPLPLMVIKRGNLDYNNDLFATYLNSHNLSLAPHGKTTMSPQIFDTQMRHGAWGITAASVSQLQVMRHHGVQRIILANQLVGKSNVRTVVSELNADPDFEFFCFVDSIAQIQNIDRNLQGHTPKRAINVLVEIGASGGRTGLRDKQQALALIDEIITRPDHFRFCGIGAFEGAIPGLDKSAAPVAAYADLILDIARAIPFSAYAGLDEFILTGGGSSYFDIIAARFKGLDLDIPVRVLLRSGCYVTNDHGAYRNAQEQARLDPNRHWHEQFRPALEVWSYVQSLPEPSLGFLTMGKRDVPFDAGLPVPFKRYRPGVGFLDVGECEVFNTNDQHAYVRLGAGSDWRVGDMICSGISHPCTAFDKWRFIPIVNDDYDVIDGVMTYF
jgi:D-serine dehydratase